VVFPRIPYYAGTKSIIPQGQKTEETDILLLLTNTVVALVLERYIKRQGFFFFDRRGHCINGHFRKDEIKLDSM
jgi:hypothetical protein